MYTRIDRPTAPCMAQLSETRVTYSQNRGKGQHVSAETNLRWRRYLRDYHRVELEEGEKIVWTIVGSAAWSHKAPQWATSDVFDAGSRSNCIRPSCLSDQTSVVRGVRLVAGKVDKAQGCPTQASCMRNMCRRMAVRIHTLEPMKGQSFPTYVASRS